VRDDELPLQYLRVHVEEALATDPRVTEQGLHVDVVGHVLVVHGAVSTPERRVAVGRVAREIAGDVAVRNETHLVALDEPHEAEAVE
jgi:BON domain-containing protein